MNRVLGELYTNLNGAYEPSRDDCKWADDLMSRMCYPFESERELTESFNEWMQSMSLIFTVSVYCDL